jgi:hypothetical protein
MFTTGGTLKLGRQIQGLALLLISALAFGQASAPAKTPSAPPAKTKTSTQAPSGSQQTQAPAASAPPKVPATPSAEAAVPKTAAVITIQGLCDHTSPSLAKPAPAPPPQFCRTQVTREEFEALVSAVAPRADAQQKRAIANQYVRLLVMAKEGEKLGVDKDPQFAEQMELTRLQLKAQLAERKIQAEATNISEAELKAYYDANPPAFEEVTVTRIFVPKLAESAGASTPAADPKQVAENARQQLKQGVDPAKIQTEAFQAVKAQAEAPPTKREHLRHGSFSPTEEQQIFALKPGEVSEVLQDPIGYSVYRMEARSILPFDSVKDDVKRAIAGQRLKDKAASIFDPNKTELNEAYFGPAPSSQAAPQSPQPRDRQAPGLEDAKPPAQKSPPPSTPGATPPPKN